VYAGNPFKLDIRVHYLMNEAFNRWVN